MKVAVARRHSGWN